MNLSIEMCMIFGKSFRFGNLGYPNPVVAICYDGSLILYDDKTESLLCINSPAEEIVRDSMIRNRK
jgi:hypothetical protein